MAKKLTDEMKRFISTTHTETDDVSKTLRAFGDRFGYLPSAKTVEKYKEYNKTSPLEEHEEEEEDEGDEGDISTKTKDSRLDKGSIDISGDEIDEDKFNRLCRNIGKSQHETFKLLQKARKKGYTKVDIATGDVEK